ncbi:MAG: metallopeptidase TldD-related protein, partial [Nannocystaceae bacterium]
VTACASVPGMQRGDPSTVRLETSGLRVSKDAGVELPAATRALVRLLEEVQTEHFEQLAQPEDDTPAYYIGYDVLDTRVRWISARSGATVEDSMERSRTLDVDVRVGSRALDNGNPSAGYERNGLGVGATLPLDPAPLALRQRIWEVTDAQYAAALEAYAQVSSEVQLQGSTESLPADFGPPIPRGHHVWSAPSDVGPAWSRWRTRVEELSAFLEEDPSVLTASVSLQLVERVHHVVDTDGGRAVFAKTGVRLSMEVSAQADDGMLLDRFMSFDGQDLDDLPDEPVLNDEALRLRREVVALRGAALAEPFSGPAILDGRAAAVFFHEVFGHRLEGHRQRSRAEGQTFARMIGEQVLPAFLNVVDDPTATHLNGNPLAGHYLIDDEGIPSEQVTLVTDGVLRDFLRSRAPVDVGDRSNGHGRRAPGYQTVARQGNLIVSANATVSEDDLRDALLKLVRRQGKPYGLWFKEIVGGYTTTERSGAQAFEVLPVIVYRVYADGRPDELVRGVDMVGTPLSALETILAAGDRVEVFNGVCGAESGWVPVSASSPALLLQQLEIERSDRELERPPLLVPPPRSSQDGRESLEAAP